MGFDSGLTSVTGNVTTSVSSNSLPVLSTNQVCQSVVTVANGSSQTVLTVAAGHKFYLYGVSVNGVAGGLTIYKTDGTTAVLLITNVAASGSNIVAPVPIWVYNAGESVKVTGTNTQGYIIYGIDYTI